MRVAVVLAVLLIPTGLASAARAGTGTADLSASDASVTFGDEVTLSGAVGGDPVCLANRAVELAWRAADAPDFTPLETATTSADGAFSFVRSEPHTGRYRATLAATAGCAEIVSNAIQVRVRVRVDASLVSASTEAGSCVRIAVATSPPKPDQTVELRRRVDGAWSAVETIPTDAAGEAIAEPCLTWDDIGVVRYRVRWPAQDALNVAGSSPTLAIQVEQARWMHRIDEAIGHHAVSVSVGDEDEYLYRRADQTARTPASNTKLLLAMAALDVFGADHRIVTRVSADEVAGGIVEGDLWILGRGDPLIRRSSLADLADAIVAAGVTRVQGSVMGSTSYFLRDWGAPGWNEVARDYVNRPTALTFEGNHDPDPEREAARALTKQLEQRGVRVAGDPGTGAAPGGIDEIATIESKPLRVLLARMLRPSWNFGAEVLGKALGAETQGPPGTIAKGARTIQAWVNDHGADFALFDNSGLSYDNRVTAAGIVRLLWAAEDAPWGEQLRKALPTGGQGTLEDRLHGVQVRAKTGTLTDISALSGWVWSEHREAWLEFSILCAGMSKPDASAIEDRIVRLLQNVAG
jgi:D-alanyl-D-alanine carboxypeptidase/D-alanyl-D-alanine-endopeptidase (penicillin-binding protein 4)